LHPWDLVVVRQNDRVPLSSQRSDFPLKRRKVYMHLKIESFRHLALPDSEP